MPIANSPRAIELCVDKAATSFRCFNAGIATPETFALESPRQTRALARRECARGPLVLKPLFGAQGRGLKLIWQSLGAAGHRRVWLMSIICSAISARARDGFSDCRVLVAGGPRAGGHDAAGVALDH